MLQNVDTSNNLQNTNNILSGKDAHKKTGVHSLLKVTKRTTKVNTLIAVTDTMASRWPTTDHPNLFNYNITRIINFLLERKKGYFLGSQVGFKRVFILLTRVIIYNVRSTLCS